MRRKNGSRAASLVALVWLVACSGEAPTEPAPPPAEAPAGDPWFEDVGSRAGIDFVLQSGHRERFLFPEGVVGGAALFDADGDGFLDAYFVQAGGLEDSAAPQRANRLFRNDGTGRFEDVTAASGTGDTGWGMGAAVGDYDNDGDIDLYVTNLGPNTLLRNEGDGTFTDVTAASGAGDSGFGASAGFLDFDRDGDLDLFVVNYVNWTLESEIVCYNTFGAPDYCYPNNYNAPAADTLLRNEGDGTFTDVTERAGLLAAFGNGLGLAPGDFDGDGWIDVFVSNDSMMNQLWMNQGDGTFVDEALLRGCAIDEHGRTKAGMGTQAADPDDDGDLDLVVVNLKTQSDSFYRNERGYFSDRTAAAGLAVASRMFTRFGIGMHDFDNDGYLDVYEVAGGVQLVSEPWADDPFSHPNVLLRGLPGGKLEAVIPRGGTDPELIRTSRAAAFGDVDNDGGVDVLIVNRDSPAQLLRNVVSERGHWLLLRVLEEHGRDALGATVWVQVARRTLRRDVQPAYSYLAANDVRVHIGLGAATAVEELRVRWVDGSEESFGAIEADRIVTLKRGEGGSAPGS
jgi:hypothetical protein